MSIIKGLKAPRWFAGKNMAWMPMQSLDSLAAYRKGPNRRELILIVKLV